MSAPTMLDSAIAVETPEGVALRLRVAGPVVRATAWSIDVAIRGAVYTAASFFFSLFGELGWGVIMIGMFLAEWLYPVLFEVLRHGQTPGKRAMGLATLREDGTPVGWSESIIRNFLWIVDFLPLFYLAGLVSMLFSADFKRLGDLAAGTVVAFRDEAPLRVLELPDVRPRPVPLPLEIEEQRAIISFAQRAPDWTEERSEELARKAEPLVAGREDPVATLFAYAAWLIGRRP